jgi:hypothetical protein
MIPTIALSIVEVAKQMDDEGIVKYEPPSTFEGLFGETISKLFAWFIV